jgi:hypothetical protein
MSVLDSAASAALDAQVIKPVFFMYLDFVGGAVRANTSGMNITPTGTMYLEMNGHEFVGLRADFLDVSAVSYAPGGSKTVTATLSGLPEVDNDTLELLANSDNWRGRDAMIWRVIRNAANVQQGAYHRYYTGKMTMVSHKGSVEEQSISVTIESYLAALSEPSNRTYLDQERYDPGDLSAKATVAVANGNLEASVAPGGIAGPLAAYRDGAVNRLLGR